MTKDANFLAAGGHGSTPHPNDVDRKRIERTLEGRARYKYVSPEVRPAPGGYLVRSPCCSRNVDRSGGTIDIARLIFEPARAAWLLYRKDHTAQTWEPFAGFRRLADALELLNEDPERKFWQ